MASQPHDMSGKICHLCGTVLTKQSFTGNIRYIEKESNMIVYRKACLDCMNQHYSRGE